MGIDHVIKAFCLIELLQTLPEGFQVVPNQVRNLSILDEDGDYVGIVDLNYETAELFEAGNDG